MTWTEKHYTIVSMEKSNCNGAFTQLLLLNCQSNDLMFFKACLALWNRSSLLLIHAFLVTFRFAVFKETVEIPCVLHTVSPNVNILQTILQCYNQKTEMDTIHQSHSYFTCLYVLIYIFSLCNFVTL